MKVNIEISMKAKTCIECIPETEAFQFFKRCFQLKKQTIWKN